jgi:DNA-binding SARP family transcriptional activator
VHLHLHGYPTLLLDDRRTALKLKHAFALLAVLSRTRGPLARTHLAHLLWSEGAADTLRARLRRLVHQTQQLVGSPLFDGDADSLALREGWSSDLQRTRAAMSRLAAALEGANTVARRVALGIHPTWGTPRGEEQAQKNAKAAAARTAAAGSTDATTLALLAQPLLAREAAGVLEGFALGSEAFDAWLDQERRSHAAALTLLLERLAAKSLELHAPALAEQAAWALLRLDSCNEGAHRARLAARTALGDAAGVETAYFECARALREELGLAPSAGLEAAYAQAQATLARLAQAARSADAAPRDPQRRVA